MSAGVNMLSEVNRNRCNILTVAISLSAGLGLQTVPEVMQHLSSTVKVLLTSGLIHASGAVCDTLNNAVQKFAKKKQGQKTLLSRFISPVDIRVATPSRVSSLSRKTNP